jgi:hypothetical protein
MRNETDRHSWSSSWAKAIPGLTNNRIATSPPRPSIAIRGAGLCGRAADAGVSRRDATGRPRDDRDRPSEAAAVGSHRRCGPSPCATSTKGCERSVKLKWCGTVDLSARAGYGSQGIGTGARARPRAVQTRGRAAECRAIVAR